MTFLSPVVRRLLDEHGLDPAGITGSGRGGRITRADVLAHAANRPAVHDGDEIVPFDRARQTTARRMRSSLDIAAHAHVSMAVDYSTVDRIRRRHGLGYLPFVARAIVTALREHPGLNAAADTDRTILRHRINLGIAVDLDGEALVVPVLHDADRLRLRPLATAIADLADRARRRRLDGDAFRDGTFTITNVGGHGTHTSTPILDRPQVGICSVDGIRPTPVAVPTGEGEWGTAIHPVGHLSLGFDHRAVDGAAAAAFLAAVRDHLENRDWESEAAP